MKFFEVYKVDCCLGFFLLLRSKCMSFLVNVVKLSDWLWGLIDLIRCCVGFVLLSIIYIRMCWIVWSILEELSWMNVLLEWIWILVLRRVDSMVVESWEDRCVMSIVKIMMKVVVVLVVLLCGSVKVRILLMMDGWDRWVKIVDWLCWLIDWNLIFWKY